MINRAQVLGLTAAPAEGQTTTVEWQQGQQNFVITGLR